MNYHMDNAFHDCSAQCWLCSHAALSPGSQEPKITCKFWTQQIVRKWSFLSGWKNHELIAVIKFPYPFSRKTGGHVFSITDASMPPTAETVHPALYPTAAS